MTLGGTLSKELTLKADMVRSCTELLINSTTTIGASTSEKLSDSVCPKKLSVECRSLPWCPC